MVHHLAVALLDGAHVKLARLLACGDGGGASAGVAKEDAMPGGGVQAVAGSSVAKHSVGKSLDIDEERAGVSGSGKTSRSVRSAAARRKRAGSAPAGAGLAVGDLGDEWADSVGSRAASAGGSARVLRARRSGIYIYLLDAPMN